MTDSPERNDINNDKDPLIRAKEQYDPSARKYEKEASKAYTKASTASPLREWVENFFYHYKWHTIAAAIALFAIIICSVQTCSRVKYDFHIMYAGSDVISTSRTESDVSEHERMLNAIKSFVSDRNNDGVCNVNLLTLYLPSSEEIKELNASGAYVNEQAIKENEETLNQYMFYGDYYICILSERLFLKWGANANDTPFESIDAFLPKDAKIADGEDDDGYRILAGSAVYLSSTPLGDLPAFSSLGNDTVIAIRKNTSKDTEAYEYAKEAFARMLAGKALG